MPRTAHRLKDFLIAPILNPGLINTVESTDSLLPYRPEPEPELIKIEPEITEISVTVDIPGLAFEAEGPFDPPWYEPVAEGEIKPVEIKPEPEKETEKETQEETTPANYGIDRAEGFYCQANDTSYASAEEFQAKCQAPTNTLTPSTPTNPTTPGPTFTETMTKAKSGGGGGLLLLALALLGD